MSLETRVLLLMFSLELEIAEVAVQSIHQNSKSFCEELCRGNGSLTVLSTFCCYDHDAKAPTTVQKIATDQKAYCKWSSYVIIF